MADVVTRAALMLDARDWDLFEVCLAAEVRACFQSGIELLGRAAVVEALRRSLSPLTVMQHLVSVLEVRIEAEEATVVSYVQARHLRTGAQGGEVFTLWGRYDDVLHRGGAGWQIVDRRLSVLMSEGNPAVFGP